MKVSTHDLEEAGDALDSLKSQYLRERGWTYTCCSPGSYWYWVKEYKGERWTSFSIDSAISVQEGMEQ